ncbi:ATP-binding protein [Methanobrevibacter sp.]
MKILCIGSRLFDDVAPYFNEKEYDSILTESNPNAENLNMADDYFIGPRGMVFPFNVAIERNVDGVVPLIGIDPPLIDVAAMKEKIESEYGIPVVASKLKPVRIASDKSKTKELFNSIGINTPESAYINKKDLNDFENIIENAGFTYPVVLKQNAGQAGKDIKVAQNFDDVIEYFNDFDEALCENFVEGAEISIETLGWKGKYLPLVPVYKGDTSVEGIHPIKRIRYGPINIKGLDNEEVRSCALKIAENLKFEGNMDLDFIYDYSSSKLYAIEANTRPSGTRYLTQASSTINPLVKLIDMAAGTFNIDEVKEEIENYYCAEIPVGTFEGEIPDKTFNDKDYIVHGPENYQRITIRSSSKEDLIERVKELTGRTIEINH